MPRACSPALLALACCLLAGPAAGPAPAQPVVSHPAPVGAITALIEPMTRQVVQRRDDNLGNILVIGTYAGNVDGFQAQSFLRPGMLGRALGWTALVDVTILQGHFVGIFRQPAGGFYDLQIRPTYQGQAGLPMNIYAVGVGEVFITAGQSNSTNFGLPTGFAPDVRVSSFNPGPTFGVDPKFPGVGWQYGIDPQPAVDESTGGSTWPTMANNLAVVMGVPIGLYAAGSGGTAIEQWLPGFVTPANSFAPSLSLFSRLTNAINFFTSRGGVRGVLWIQGETDYGLDTDPLVYEANLRLIIGQSRQVTGVPIKWMIAQTTTPLTNNMLERAGLETAQYGVVDNVLTFPGPDADSIGLPYRIEVVGGPLHFNATGLVLLGGYWGIYVYNFPGFLAAGALPAP